MSDAAKVLIVDDDPDFRGYLKDCLAELGYQSDEAPDGPEALEGLSKETYEVLLLDLHMPKMDGATVASRIRGSSPRVVFLTSAPAEEVGEALGQGPHYYLPKGASPAQLGLLLESMLG